MQETKCLEYYLDSRLYSGEQVQESINETKKQFPNKKIKVRIALNDFGVYIITFKFEEKNNYFSKMKIKLIKYFQRPLMLEKENKKQKTYGQYKQTGNYKPY